MAHATVPDIEPPYVVALVELEAPSGIRLVGNVVEHDAVDLHVDLSLEAVFTRQAEDVTLINWRPYGSRE